LVPSLPFLPVLSFRLPVISWNSFFPQHLFSPPGAPCPFCCPRHRYSVLTAFLLSVKAGDVSMFLPLKTFPCGSPPNRGVAPALLFCHFRRRESKAGPGFMVFFPSLAASPLLCPGSVGLFTEFFFLSYPPGLVGFFVFRSRSQLLRSTLRFSLRTVSSRSTSTPWAALLTWTRFLSPFPPPRTIFSRRTNIFL